MNVLLLCKNDDEKTELMNYLNSFNLTVLQLKNDSAPEEIVNEIFIKKDLLVICDLNYFENSCFDVKNFRKLFFNFVSTPIFFFGGSEVSENSLLNYWYEYNDRDIMSKEVILFAQKFGEFLEKLSNHGKRVYYQKRIPFQSKNLLEYFKKNANRTISIEEIEKFLWGGNSSKKHETIYVYINNLRKILAADKSRNANIMHMEKRCYQYVEYCENDTEESVVCESSKPVFMLDE